MLNRNSSLLSDLKNGFFGHKAVSSLLALGLFLAPATTHSAFATESDADNTVRWSGTLAAPEPPPCTIKLGRNGILGFAGNGRQINSDVANKGQTAQLEVSTNRAGLALFAGELALKRDSTDVSFYFEMDAGFGSKVGNSAVDSDSDDGRAKLLLSASENDRLVDVWFSGAFGKYSRHGEPMPDGTYSAESTITCEVGMKTSPGS